MSRITPRLPARTLAAVFLAAVFLAALLLGGALPASAAPTVTPTVIASYPHDPAAFTQGLLLHDGFLFESTGLEGQSSLRRVERVTGEVLQSVALRPDQFGEGLALFEGRFVQLTWHNGVATVRDEATFAELSTFTYAGEGWGLCHDGRRYVMTDGSDRLFFRDSASFEVLGSVTVQEDGVPFQRLNELECVGGTVLANVWQTDTILHIDPETGDVLTKIDASGLLTSAEAVQADVLNGIAFDAAAGRFLLTGKLWPRLFEVELELGLDSGTDLEDDAAAGAGLLSDAGVSPGGGAPPGVGEPTAVDPLTGADRPSDPGAASGSAPAPSPSAPERLSSSSEGSMCSMHPPAGGPSSAWRVAGIVAAIVGWRARRY